MRKPLGVILAGGQGRRMGQVSKADLMLGARRLLDLSIDRLDPQVDGIVVNANGPIATDLDVIPDTTDDFAGPLSGILAALIHAEGAGHSHVASVAVDTPFFPCDLVPRLQLAGLDQSDGFAVAADGSGVHGTFGLWPVALRPTLADFLASGGRKVRAFTASQNAAIALFPDTTPSAFFNINTPDDLKDANAWI
ncbi:molybdenum cofactor guanylyltransferase MobA [Pseudooctadecabacter sp.]|uniref:molybdenum cofactor guanylyltransferase MobA n=1 Tax=Pseudooctadecabacter sp. TaxID=1966338 RepID=UPI0035C835AD